MKYYNDIRELIGNTPIVKLNNIDFPKNVNLFAKLELANPGGSVKDRMGLAVISAAEKEGLLKPGSTIVETTAGNAGIGIALAAIGKGYKVIFTVPLKFSQEKQQIMRALGAEIINTPYEDGMQGAFKKAEEIVRSIPNAVCLDQFKNPANPKAHYQQTGKEIYDDLEGQIDYLVAGAGSGGTISGIAKYLKSKNKNIKAVLADPEGSTMGGGQEGCYKVEGIGNTFFPETFDRNIIDEVIKTNDNDSFKEVKQLALKEGILAGASSGAALSAARKLAEKIKSGNIIVIFPDRGDRYLSKKIYA
ncbi:PLP-dependent cysteine synthase family protein [Endomicrobium proavitum]|uniref:cysteine synthase n=1 Tax=Endomicrobium proavitum TaxID=1408281 RepID=A0A0G3WKR0_9BACT|nr:cysteine synthase family protein [Endomicrobium proavitum]AKL98069.1 O-acetylserine dependent cystathionine beta-synthase [Endomicrobium proavitum]